MTPEGRAGALLALLLAVACERRSPAPAPPRAEFGLWFGGQIQERERVPFDLDPARATLVLRVELAAPRDAPLEIDYRIDAPTGPQRGAPPPPGARAAGTLVLRAGETRIEQPFTFRPGDPLGLWSVRATAAGRLLIDRPFEVHDARELPRPVGLDAGP